MLQVVSKTRISISLSACFVEGQRLPNCSTADLSTIDSPCIAIENVYLMSEERESLDCYMIFFF